MVGAQQELDGSTHINFGLLCVVGRSLTSSSLCGSVMPRPLHPPNLFWPFQRKLQLHINSASPVAIHVCLGTGISASCRPGRICVFVYLPNFN